jgi:hypothetical protein
MCCDKCRYSFDKFYAEDSDSRTSRLWCAGADPMNAASNGHLNCLIALEQRQYGRIMMDRYHICREAASMGHLDCLIYAHENHLGRPWGYMQ